MKVGLQLYSCLDKIMDREGLLRTIEAVGEMGYDGIELINIGGYSATPARELKDAIEASGMELINIHMHLPFEVWFGEMREELVHARDAGLKMITLPFISEEQRSAELYEKIIANISVWISMCREYGLSFCYHNHNFELESYGGKTLLEAIAAADPEMKIELDTFWTYFSGKDPVEMMEKLGGKLCLIHIKDYKELSSFHEMKFTAIGTGKMDNAGICKKAAKMDQRWIIVEQDNSPIDTLQSARLSLEGVRKLHKEAAWKMR